MEKQIIRAYWPYSGTINAPRREYKAVAVYDADEEMEEMDIRKGAWVEYEDTLVEAFLYGDDEDWSLDDIGLHNLTSKTVDEPYPNADKLVGTGWHLESYHVEYCPGEYFWKPVKDA